MSCLRCEIVRAKMIAMGMHGLRRSAKEIADELRGRYGDDYGYAGCRVVRKIGREYVTIIEVRRAV